MLCHGDPQRLRGNVVIVIEALSKASRPVQPVVSSIAALFNRVYARAERALWRDAATRTTMAVDETLSGSVTLLPMRFWALVQFVPTAWQSAQSSPPPHLRRGAPLTDANMPRYRRLSISLVVAVKLIDHFRGRRLVVPAETPAAQRRGAQEVTRR